MRDKDIIKRNFSRYAAVYDKYADIQQICGGELIDTLKTGEFSRILEIGCGTGNFTRLLRKRFPRASILAMDISPEMIKVAKSKLKGCDIDFVTGDGEIIDHEESFDLIGSNASFQWFHDLRGLLEKYYSYLATEGMILFSLFGPGTFYQLHHSLKKLFGEETRINSGLFPEYFKIKIMLESLFGRTEIKRKLYKEKHASLSGLLHKIKYTGTRGKGVIAAGGLWNSRKIYELEKIYIDEFKEIITDYEVFFCKIIK